MRMTLKQLKSLIHEAFKEDHKPFEYDIDPKSFSDYCSKCGDAEVYCPRENACGDCCTCRSRSDNEDWVNELSKICIGNYFTISPIKTKSGVINGMYIAIANKQSRKSNYHKEQLGLNRDISKGRVTKEYYVMYHLDNEEWISIDDLDERDVDAVDNLSNIADRLLKRINEPSKIYN